MFKNDTEITAICEVALYPRILSFGTKDGIIKDLDTNTKCIIRRAGNIHENGEAITAMTSSGKYLVSACENGTVVVYDYAN